VHDALTADGCRVAIVQNPTLSLEDDAAVTRRVIDDLDGPAVLVGHSYGGAVITEAGLHEKVAALVYITAFAPDKGESVNTLIAGFPADGPQPPIPPPRDGFLFLDRDKFHASFAGDLPAGQAAFMADSQVPWGVNALGGTISEASWRIKPSWYLVATDDRMIRRRRSVRWPNAPGPPSPRSPAATRSTCPSPRPSPRSSSRPPANTRFPLTPPVRSRHRRRRDRTT
jgi:pimeloyl-ACP methyl ester carboxylesterase